MGWDLLHKLHATIIFGGGEEPWIEVEGKLLVTVPIDEEYLLYEKDPPTGGEFLEKWKREIPGVWAETKPPGLAKEQAPIHVQLTSMARPVRVRQYPMTIEARRGVHENIRKLKAAGILAPSQSPWNTPLLPVKKQETGEYRMVQDLREVNKRVETIHPTVPNPYTPLSLLPPDRTWYSVLDLKDAFFCLPLAPKSQLLFAFEWNDPEDGESGQLSWTRLPQGFKNSPTLFDEALSQDLQGYRIEHPEVTLLQYVDDFLDAANTEDGCVQATRDLLQALYQRGYRVSARKAQLCVKKVVYLGFQIGGTQTLAESQVQAVLQIPTLKTKRQV